MDTKRVLILTYYWPPSGGAGVQRWLKFAKYLPKYGVTPTIITVDPRKASYPLTDSSLCDEVSADVKVIRTKSFEPLQLLSKVVGKKQVPHAGFSNVNTQSPLQRILRFVRGNFFIPDARVGWNRYAYKAAKNEILHQKFDAVITTGPPHSTHLVGLKLKRKLGVRWLADFRDPWTDIYYYNQLMHLPVVKKRDLFLEKLVLNEADEILTVGNTLKKSLEGKVDNQLVRVVPNGFDTADFKQFSIDKPKRFTITYTGTLAEQYNISAFLDACILMKQQDMDFAIRFVGQVADSVVAKFAHAGLSSQLELIPYVEHHEALNYLSKSSALLLVLPDIPGNKGILTGKLFEYLASGLPIIGIGPQDSDTAEVLNETQAGKMFANEDGVQIFQYLLKLKSNEIPSIVDGSREAYSRANLALHLAGLL
jgi:glycosyltransferase involved in cell wall biosynthesis